MAMAKSRRVRRRDTSGGGRFLCGLRRQLLPTGGFSRHLLDVDGVERVTSRYLQKPASERATRGRGRGRSIMVVVCRLRPRQRPDGVARDRSTVASRGKGVAPFRIFSVFSLLILAHFFSTSRYGLGESDQVVPVGDNPSAKVVPIGDNPSAKVVGCNGATRSVYWWRANCRPWQVSIGATYVEDLVLFRQ
ncbi:hypothetical protein CASFOL_011363 [Castilleja foliolosa]|uniref:Uncharacterized protein n=1 Tax=Castilleja foliolosa TaxID=1961234 RepID=A0ABD3DVB1_9LAMI